MNKSIFFTIFLLLNFLYNADSHCFLHRPGWRNPLNLGFKGGFKEDLPTFTEYKNILKNSFVKEKTNGNIITIEKNLVVDQKTYNDLVDNSFKLKAFWFAWKQIYYFQRNAAKIFGKSHFEGQ